MIRLPLASSVATTSVAVPLATSPKSFGGGRIVNCWKIVSGVLSHVRPIVCAWKSGPIAATVVGPTVTAIDAGPARPDVLGIVNDNVEHVDGQSPTEIPPPGTMMGAGCPGPAGSNVSATTL